MTAGQVARRRRIIDAAVELASEGGYDVVQMREVAARAKVALGTIYRYFESKDQLLAAALTTWAAGLERQLTSRPPTGDTPTDRVVGVIRKASRSIERNQRLSSALVTAIASPDPGIHAYQADIDEILSRMLSAALEDLEDSQRVIVVRILSHVWFAALIGWVHGWRGVRSVGAEMEDAARFLLAR
ncbi:MAG: TetR family transcriptional regulator [Actinomycetota bacterium]|nr:TetR family transcriptional regulator [Actinomycetota bacterium]